MEKLEVVMNKIAVNEQGDVIDKEAAVELLFNEFKEGNLTLVELERSLLCIIAGHKWKNGVCRVCGLKL